MKHIFFILSVLLVGGANGQPAKFWKKPIPFQNVNIVVDGNSISTDYYGTSWLNQLIPMISSYSPTYTNVSVSGQRTTDMIADYQSQVAPLYVPGVRNILVFLTESNDVGYVYPDSAFHNLQLYGNMARTTGFEVITSTMLPRYDRSDSILLTPLNNKIIAGWRTFADTFIDLRNVPELAILNSTYYNTDNVHPNTAGNGKIAAGVFITMKEKYGL